MPDDQPFSRTGFFRFLNYWAPEVAQNNSGAVPVNPKGFFANERTFLSWLQLCLILGSLGIGFINFSDSPGATTSGFLFIAVTVGMMFYALAQYHIRLSQLQRKDKGLVFEDIYGTFVLVGVVFLAVLTNFIIHFVYE